MTLRTRGNKYMDKVSANKQGERDVDSPINKYELGREGSPPAHMLDQGRRLEGMSLVIQSTNTIFQMSRGKELDCVVMTVG